MDPLLLLNNDSFILLCVELNDKQLRIAGLWAKIPIWDLPDIKQECIFMQVLG
jgi:hypothetical protein